MGVQTRRTLLLLLVLILLLTFFPMDVAQEDPATLRISIPAGTVIGPDSDPWLNEGWLLNLTGASWEFTVRVNETSNVHTSYETHLIVALNDFAYNNLSSLVINGTAIQKADFQYGIPEPYNLGWSWPDDVYPTWFNDANISLGIIQPFGYTEANVSATFSDPTGARMHFDAYGKIVTGEPQDIGGFTWSPNSEDATVVSAGTPSGTPPHAEFTYSPTYPIVGENVTFNASKSDDSDGTIVNYTWNFGDGNFTTVTDPIVDHHYTWYGNYTVGLAVKDNDNLIGYATATVNVLDTEPPVFVEVWREPETPAYNETVTVKANVTDEGSGVESVILSYSNDTITWTNATMDLVEELYVGEIPAFPYGTTVYYKIYAYDNAGNLAIEVTHSSYNVTDPYPPVIGVPTWDPEEPFAGEEVTVVVSVSEPADASGVKNVTLWYRTDGEWQSIEMTETALENWTATIPGQSAGVNVTFYIESYDNAGNNASTLTYNYTVKALSPGPPVAIFTYLPPTPSTGETVTFNATASYDPDGTIVSYAWDFGDNTTGAGNITTHSYTDNGTYTVTLNVTDNDGLFNTTSANVTVLNRPPVASFTENATTVLTDEVISFNASDSSDPDGSIISYFWDFGDGTNATGVTAEHAYTAAGTYTVTLNVTDNDGATDTANSTKTVLEGIVYPVANFTVSPDSPYHAPIELTFNGSEPISYDLDGPIVSWNWTIQNETMAVIANLTGPVVSYNFTASGTYTINLTVTDDDGLINSTSKPILIEKSPAARFTYSPDKPLVGEPVTFNASDSTPDGGGIVSYEWDFGDGNNGTGMIVNHTYTAHGTYTVTLNVTDSEGLWDTTSAPVKVYAPPVANFTYSPSVPKAGENVTFDASLSDDPDGTIANYEWNFGDGTPLDYGMIVNHTYATNGTYPVILTVTDNDTLTNSTTLNVTVIDYPVANFNVSPPSPYYTPATLTFNASGSTPNGGTIISYEWNFGDGNNGSGMVVDHTYTDAGTFTVTLNVTDSEGLWNTTSEEITVDRRDVAVISVVPAKDQVYPTWIPPLNITVTVLNNGTEPANFTVTAYYDTNVIGAPQNVTNLGAGEQLNLTFSWNLTDVAYGFYDIKAVATLEGDVNPANNEFVVYDAVLVKIPGDVDGNGLVGGRDLGLLGWAWGSTEGMERYIQECDFDHDGDINGGDLGIMGYYWGESVTY